MIFSGFDSPRRVSFAHLPAQNLRSANSTSLVYLSNGLGMRELRQREPNGHQVSMRCSDYHQELGMVAASLFARWCQENFFQYMSRHYGLDRLIEYGTQALPETTVVVNPVWRKKDQEVRRARALLVRQQARFAGLSLPEEASAAETAPGPS